MEVCDTELSFNYITLKEASKRWNLTARRISDYCKQGRIPGAVLTPGKMWLIPKDADKPMDARTCEYTSETSVKVKPFIKWAGGKGQLLPEIRKVYPPELGKSIRKYAEPFIGGGAVLFDIVSRYDLDEIYISDINKELINAYRTIRDKSDELLDALDKLQGKHLSYDDCERKTFFYKNRDRYNELKISYDGSLNVELASLFIYLNKTCFNGLYRVNSKGLYNTPSGRYKNPLICDKENIINVSECLQKVNIVCGDYKESIDFIDENTFVYFDPPYRPLTATASFTAYTEGLFNDDNQRELAQYVKTLSDKGAKVAISNSDPKNSNDNDEFFDELYCEHNISRISANRAINSKATGRGKINELLITNY